MDALELRTLLFVLSWLCSKATIIDVRLVDGESPNKGRIEVNIEAVGWNTVCGTSWDMNDVMVTCRQLGFSGAQLEVTRSEFGSGTFPISKESLFCKGKEETLNDCPMRKTRCGGGNVAAGAVCHGRSYLGCYGDNPLMRPLSGDSYTDMSNMTINHCISFCRLLNFEYAGVEYGSECYCGSQTSNYSQYGRYDDSECRHKCTGNPLETCGGIAKMAVHTTVGPTTTTPTTQSTISTSARTPSGLGEMDTDATSASSQTSATAGSTKGPQSFKDSKIDDMMLTVVYVLGALLLLCVVIITGCVAWNCKLRSRLRRSYDLADDDRAPSPGGDANALPYMSLSERRTDENGYQSLSVQRKAEQGGRRDGPYARGLGDPVYQEPAAVYMDPDNMCSVSFNSKPGNSNTDELLGGNNEYEMLGT